MDGLFFRDPPGTITASLERGVGSIHTGVETVVVCLRLCNYQGRDQGCQLMNVADYRVTETSQAYQSRLILAILI